jgi:hypothetical protein
MENNMKNSNSADASGSAPDRSSNAAPDPAAAPALSRTEQIDEKIEIWFAKHFHNLGALLDERMHNVIHAAKEDLKAELAKLSSSIPG